MAFEFPVAVKAKLLPTAIHSSLYSSITDRHNQYAQRRPKEFFQEGARGQRLEHGERGAHSRIPVSNGASAPFHTPVGVHEYTRAYRTKLDNNSADKRFKN